MSRPVVLVPEIDAAHFEADQFEVWPTGSEFLELHAETLTERLVDSGVSEVVIPLGLPRRQLLFVAGWVATTSRLRFRIASPWLGLRWRPAVVAALVILTLFVRIPTSLVLRTGRAIDGMVLTAHAAAVRRLPRRSATAHAEIWHVITHLGTGGAQQQLLQYLRHTTRAGDATDLAVVSLFAGNRAFESRLRETGVPVTILDDRLRATVWGRATSAVFPYYSVLLALTRMVRLERPHTVFCWLFLANAIGATAARSSGVPRVVTSVRNMSAWKTWPEYRRWWYRPIDRVTAPMSDVIVANADAVAKDFGAWSGCGPDRFRVVPNAVDVDRLLSLEWHDLRPRLSRGHGWPIVLTIGRFSHEKRHALLLEMVAAVRERGVDVRCVMAGHGELEDALRQRAEELGLSEHVEFYGKTAEPQGLYRAADMFVLTSRIEGMPNVLLEAHAFGLPVVTTAAGGAGEVVEDRVTGLVVPVDDLDGLISSTSALLEDPQRRRTMGVAAQQRVRQHFPVERLVAEIDGLTGRRRPADAPPGEGR